MNTIASRGLLVLPLLLITAACAQPPVTRSDTPTLTQRTHQAVRQAKEIRASGKRLWCVPFARTASGIDIYGDARTWWRQARLRYDRDRDPRVGAVMAFRPTRRMPLGHVAVVSKIVSPREILVNQANWKRNQVSLDVAVIDVSRNNDWSAVRVANTTDSFGGIYPVLGFITDQSVQPEARPAAPTAPVEAQARAAGTAGAPAKAVLAAATSRSLVPIAAGVHKAALETAGERVASAGIRPAPRPPWLPGN